MQEAAGSGYAPKVTVNPTGQIVTYTRQPGEGGAPNPGAPITLTGPAGSAVPDPNSPGNYMNPSGSSTTDGSTTPPTDWSSYLNIFGLPPDVQAKVNQIFSSTQDVNQAAAIAMAYIRGTDWYAQTYPGIQEGMARGVVSNESDYRQYVNQLNQLSQQFYGRDITSQDITNYLRAGYSPTHVGQLFQGHAIAQANGPDWQYLSGAFGDTGRLSNDQIETLGQEGAGLDTALGLKLQNVIQKASQRAQQVFSGTLATPSLALGNGLQSPSLAGTKASAAPDVAA